LRHCAYGDLFLEDVRAYRERQLSREGWSGVFPLWGSDTRELSREFVMQGHRAVLTCVDTTQLDGAFSGRDYDADFLDDLPENVDPCGEHGEFHTLSYGGPMFAHALPLKRGESVLREERFRYTDFLLEQMPPE